MAIVHKISIGSGGSNDSPQSSGMGPEGLPIAFTLPAATTRGVVMVYESEAKRPNWELRGEVAKVLER